MTSKRKSTRGVAPQDDAPRGRRKKEYLHPLCPDLSLSRKRQKKSEGKDGEFLLEREGKAEKASREDPALQRLHLSP